jgi:hypothetical protein
MSGLLERRIAAVTGGGWASAERARWVMQGRERRLDVNVETATQSQKAIRDAGSKAWSFKLDVTDRDAWPESCQRDQRDDRHGGLPLSIDPT